MACESPGNDEYLEGTEDNTDSLMSDEIKEMFCEDCDKDLGVVNKADGFCVNCLEYLCSTCIRYHKKYYTDHTLQDSSSMPQDFCFDKCKKHSKEILKFYCKACDTTACPKCKTEMHNSCDEVCHIPLAVLSDTMAAELGQLSVLIEDTLEELAATQDRLETNLKEANSNKEDATTAMQKHKIELKQKVQDKHKHLLEDLNTQQKNRMRKYEQKRAQIINELDAERWKLQNDFPEEKTQMTQLLEKKQNNMFAKLDSSEQKLEEEIQHIGQNLSHILLQTINAVSEVNKIKTTTDIKKKTRKNCELFVTMKTVKSYIQKIKDGMQDTNQGIKVHSFGFQKDYDVINLKSTECHIKFGHIVNKSELKRTIFSKVEAEAGPSKKCRFNKITGLCKLFYWLVVIEEDNSLITVIDDIGNEEILTKQLKENPFDITCVEQAQVATTMPESRKIQFLAISKQGELFIDHEFDVGQCCYGIDYFKPNLFVGCQTPGCVKVFSKRGDLIKTIQNFDEPRYITVNQKSGILFVEDKVNERNAWKIKKVSTNGEVTEMTDSFHCESGLAVDHYGSVYKFDVQEHSSKENQNSQLSQRGILPAYMNSYRSLYKRVVAQDPYESVKRSLQTYSSGENKTHNQLYQLSENLKPVQIIKDFGNIGRVSCLFYCNKRNELYIGTNLGEILVYEVV